MPLSLNVTTQATQIQPYYLDSSMNPMIQSAIITDDVLRHFNWVCFLTCELIDIFGTVTNIINIICFVKQGFKDSVNISLLGLAISDLGSLGTVIWTSLCLIPAFQEADLPFIPMEVQYPTTGIPHVIFTRITSCITALITLERCLCISMPLTVKSIFTPKRVTTIIVCIFVILIVSAIPMFYVTRLAWQFYPDRNKTLLGLTSTPEREFVEQYFFIVNNFLVPFGAFFVIIICTVILVYKLRQQSEWRVHSGSYGQKNTSSDRDLRVAKMVVMISTLFVVCFIPSGIAFLAMAIVPELNHGGKHENLALLVHGVCLFLESTNSSMNIFIYYHMSSKYRDTFNTIFRRAQKSVF